MDFGSCRATLSEVAGRLWQVSETMADSFLIIMWKLSNCQNLTLSKKILNQSKRYLIRDIFDSFFSVSCIRFSFKQNFDGWLFFGMLGSPARFS